jgi:DNA-directed RNA polymerase specialized sigma subunit
MKFYRGGTKMQIDQSTLETITQLVVKTTIKTLEDKGLIKSDKKERSAYQKTEQLLYNYNGFKRVVEDKLKEIEEIKQYGVPTKSKSITQFGGASGTVQGIVLDEESVESAVRTRLASVQDTVHVISNIDKCMQKISTDQYFDILEMRYFEDRTLEDIAVYYGCGVATISRNKNRLVKELALLLFPNEVVNEIVN